MFSKGSKVHFIAIGGSTMHNLAIALHQQGVEVSGSDDQIFDPAQSNLQALGLLPEALGWHPDRIHEGVEAIVLGMHAKPDNPELQKAQALGIPLYSFPEVIFETARNKQRIVIAGSHGKTTITAMIMHVMKYHGREFDYALGAAVPGFSQAVKLSEEAPLVLIEGDEYATSPLDHRPKFLHYYHHIGLISGISWDHVNIYPTLDEYVNQFEHLADATPKAGVLIYNGEDSLTSIIARKERPDVSPLEYNQHPHHVENGTTYLLTPDGEKVPVKVFGEHNMFNISAAKRVCHRIGITEPMFYQAIGSFEGASARLEKLGEGPENIVFKDFAHAPSKLKASVEAVKQQFPGKRLTACLEIHTFSSLNKEFLPQYADKYNAADEAIVYYNPEVLTKKQLPAISPDEVRQAFNLPRLQVFTDRHALEAHLKNRQWQNSILLMMSSGNFDGMDLKGLTATITENNA